MESGEKRVQCVRVKRKASEQPQVGNKRCKLIGSFSVEDEPKAPLTLKQKELQVIDLESLPENSKLKGLFKECSEEITCNGIKLEKVTADTFVYDYYVCEDDCHSESDYMSDNDEDVSSCDENHPYNDYPDEDDYDYDEYDYYREWEDDEQREIRKTMEFRPPDDDDYDATEELSD